MLVFFNDEQALHAPVHEIFRGERVPCFENPSRADFVRTSLLARGHVLRAPLVDSAALLPKVHAPRYLDFLRTAWARWLALDAANAGTQPFPSVWPVRTLRSDVEPTNFTARLGLYSMDNGSPLSPGTWA
ncbi:MAG: histone deacetylase family protein, partial [Ottowia sp.]|nr:histone deacetylase family protein [Ottowia sp.]